MEITKSIDWLTMAHAPEAVEGFVDMIPDGFIKAAELPPQRFFPKRWMLLPAGTYAHSADGTICQKIEFTGEDLSTLRKMRKNEIGLVRHGLNAGARVTRLDYAVDLFDTSVEARDFLVLWSYGAFNPSFRSVRDFNDRSESDTASTVYFGATSSNKMVRVYDKGKQMNLLQRAWLRVELQSRKEVANALATDMEKHGMWTAGDNALRHCFDHEAVPVLRDALDEPEIPLTEIPRKETSWRRWMNEQVRQSAIKHAAEDGDREFLLEWMESLRLAIDA